MTLTPAAGSFSGGSGSVPSCGQMIRTFDALGDQGFNVGFFLGRRTLAEQDFYIVAGSLQRFAKRVSSWIQRGSSLVGSTPPQATKSIKASEAMMISSVLGKFFFILIYSYYGVILNAVR
jgi:hypothetical protein